MPRDSGDDALLVGQEWAENLSDSGAGEALAVCEGGPGGDRSVRELLPPDRRPLSPRRMEGTS